MNLNEDYFYIDGEKVYNLKYTHKELVELLKKLEEGKLLSEGQYKQLIEEIGLDNISTFDLNYYNLKNIPYIPVRLGDLYNDVGYDVKDRVDNELNILEEIINSEIVRLDSVVAELQSLNISGVLEQIQNTQNKADYIDKSIKDLNGVIFSFERTIELIRDKTMEISTEFEALKNMQETDELRLDNIHEIITVHTEDIQKLLDYYKAEKDKLSEVISIINDIEISIENLNDYQGIMKNIDIRVSDIETFIKLLNPDEIDLEKLLTLESDIKSLQQKNEEYELFHESISQQISDLTFKAQNSLDAINNNILLIQEKITENSNAISNHDRLLISHNTNLNNINLELESVALLVNKNISDIKNLELKDLETQANLSSITSDIQSLVEEDSEHRDQLENINVEITSLHNNLSESNEGIQNNLLEIETLKERLGNDESWHEETEQQLIDIQNDISNNSNKIKEIDDSLKNVNDTLIDVEDNLKRVDAEILSINTNLENHHKENEERIIEVDEAVETLNSRMGASEANFLTLQSRTSIIEDNVKTLATKEALNSINMQMHINEQGYVVVELFLEGNIVSSIIIPYNVKFEDQIAKTDSARTDYSKTI